MRFTKDIIIGEIPTASNSNYSALFQADGQVRKRTLGSIITQDIDAYLSGISVSFPTSIFNIADSSITPSQPNLVVSLKNQLAGTVFAAPETLNGTPSFRKLADVDLDQTTVAFQDDIPDVSNFVPYTGATDNVNLNSQRLLNISDLSISKPGISYPNAVNNDPLAWNRVENELLRLNVGTNTLAFIADGGATSRIFGIQVGHSNPNFANATGTLQLQPLHGNVSIGSLSGTGNRMVVADSSGILSTQSLPSDNYLRLGDYTTSQDGFPLNGGDVFNLRNTVAWATSSTNRPNNTNSAIVAFTPYKSGTSEYGFFLGARNNRLWLSTLENSTPSGWVEIAKRSEFGNYLPLSGGTMTGNIAFGTNGTGLYFQGALRTRFSTASTIIAGSSDGIQFRPTSYSNSSDAIIFYPGGQINTPNHGNSSQWKQAYDWGDFRDYGLGTGANIISDFDNQPTGSMGYTTSATLNQPPGLSYGSLFKFGSTSSFTQLFGAYTQSNRLFFRHHRNGAYYPLVEIYHTGNLTNVSQLNNDAGYITSVPDSFVTKDNISSSALDTTVIDFNNTGNGASILYAGSSSTNRPSVSGTAGGLLMRGNHVTVGEFQLYIARGENDALLYRNQSGVWNRAASREWVKSFGIGKPITEYNNISTIERGIPGGLYSTNTSTSGGPMSGSSGSLISIGSGVSGGTNSFIWVLGNNTATPRAFFTHANTSGVMQPWEEIASQSWVNSQNFSTQTLSSSTSNIISGNTVQRAALTGDVTASQNSNVTTIANSAVTHAKYQNIASKRILGRGATGTGNVQELTLGTGLSLSNAGVLSASQDSIFAYSPQGGLYTTDWSSTALGQHSIAIGYTSVVTASSSISIGKGVFTGGAMSQNIGFSSNVNKALSANVGSYNLNNGELGNTFGQGLINQGMGTTVIGKYNQVVHHQPNMDVDSKTPAIQFGVGKDELTRRNAVTIFNDRRMDYDAQRDDSAWHQYTIPDIKWIQENISGGGGGGNMNFAYIDHTNTHAFGTDEANGLLIPASLIPQKPPLVDPILGVIGVFTSHDDLGQYSTPTPETFFNAIAVGVKGDIFVRRGCIYIGDIDILGTLSGKDKLVMVYNRREDILGLEWMDSFNIMDLKDTTYAYGILIGNAFNGDSVKAYFNVNPQII